MNTEYKLASFAKKVFRIFIASSFVFASTSFSNNSLDDSSVGVRDFKFYREFIYKNSNILIQKSSLDQKIFFGKRSTSILLTQSKNSKRLYEVNVEGKTENFIVSYKNENQKGKIGVLSKKLQTYYKTEDKPFCERFTNALKSININHLSLKINELNINSMLDPKTCTDQEPAKLEALKYGLKEGLNPKTSAIIKCYNDKRFQENLFKNSYLQSYATKTLGRYLQFTNLVSEGTSPLIIKCEFPDRTGDKIASFNDQTSPKEFLFQLKKDNFDKKFGTGNFDDSLNHELLHYADQQIDPKADETAIKHFECLCNNTLREKVIDSCKDSEKTMMDIQKTAAATKSGGALAQASIQNTNRQTLEKNKDVVAENLSMIDEPRVFAPISNAAIDKLANSEILTTGGARLVLNEGEQKNVVLDPLQKKYLDEVYTKLSGTVDGVTKAISKPIALLAQKAEAKNPPTVATSQQEPSKAQIATYSTSEFLADKYGLSSLDNGNNTLPSPRLVTNEVTTQEKISQSTPYESTVRAPAAVQQKSQQTKAESEPTNEVVTTTNSIAPANSNNTTSPRKTSKETSNSRSVASIPTSQQNIRAAVDNTELQTLSALNLITGSRANAIRSRYKDPKFPKELEARGYSITVIQNGKRSVLGPENSKVSFIDDGKNLVKVQKPK